MLTDSFYCAGRVRGCQQSPDCAGRLRIAQTPWVQLLAGIISLRRVLLLCFLLHSVICSRFVSLCNYKSFHLPFKVGVDIIFLHFNSCLAYGYTILHLFVTCAKLRWHYIVTILMGANGFFYFDYRVDIVNNTGPCAFHKMQHQGPLYQHGLTLIPVLISDLMPRISDFIPHFTIKLYLK